MLVLTLAACHPPERANVHDAAAGSDTATPPPDDTAVSGTDSGTPPGTDGYCVSEQDVTSGALGAGWRSPSGALYATGVSPSSRVRAPDGTWSLDPIDRDGAWGRFVDGADDGSVWAVRASDVVRRESDGTWTGMGAPTDPYGIQGLEVFADDDVLALRVESYTCGDCPTLETPTLLWWDGASWTEDEKAEVRGSVYGMTALPDRTVILAADGGLRAVDPSPSEIATPAGMYVREVASAPDGTLVALGGDQIAIGTVAGGLAAADPGLYVDEWSSAWASSSTDVWVSGEWWELGVVPHAVIVHWDGASWTPVVEDWPGEEFAIAGGDGQVFAIGGYSHELVLVGDAGGLAVDRETWGPSSLDQLAVDDVTGQSWSAAGYSADLGVYEDGAWRGVPLPDRTIRTNTLAVSGDRVALSSSGTLWVYEGGEVVATPIEGGYFPWLAGADGVLFAAGRPPSGEYVTPPQVALLQDAGAGWVPIDVTGLPADAEPSALWADGATDLWLGLELGRKGGLAHWDGAAWTVVLDRLRAAPGWMRRLSDGQLYFTQPGEDPLMAFDGAAAATVPDMPPDVRAAHLLPDGTWFVSTVGGGDAHLMQRDPGGGWAGVFDEEYGVIPLVGSGDTVWAGENPLGWTRAPCP